MHFNSNKRTIFAAVLLVVLVVLLAYRFIAVRSADTAGTLDVAETSISAAEDTPVFLSIVGDSISTYAGFLPTEPEPYDTWYPRETLHNVEETWWMQVLSANGWTLLSNASWTGSHVTGDSTDRSGFAGCGDGRADAVRGYHNDGSILPPDIILVFMGANDFLHNIDPGAFEEGKEVVEGEQYTFADAYRMMLRQLTSRYEDARIICMTCLPCMEEDFTTAWVNAFGLGIDDYNDIIRLTAADFGMEVIDTYACGITPENASALTEEGIHPTTAGAKVLADYINRYFKD